MSKRRPVLIVGAVIVIAVVVAFIAMFVVNRGNSTNTAKVTRGSLIATIETVGQLTARNPVAVHSTLTGTVKLVAVKPGDAVQAGDVLVQIDRAPFDNAVQQAQSQLANAETALNLATVQAGSNPSAQQTATKLQADQNVIAAQQALQQAQDQIAATLILAPSNGTIIDVQTAAGTPVGQGSTVVDLANLSDLTLSIDIDEIDVPHVTTGMTATFRLDAYPGTSIDGTLTDVSPVAKTSGGTTTFPATVTFKSPAGLLLRPGMNANVSIQTAVRKNVLLIPQSAIRTVGKRTFVTTVSNGKQTEREIQIGLSSGGQVEVASGLSEGDTVVLH
ncbi:MAG TPA: efflux RND transporter periplasmic adaptor subunit [Nitrolancea sp.]|nr:efflux RND transporter periplasmic adaptor subunit [Nitrolancea sp.]